MSGLFVLGACGSSPKVALDPGEAEPSTSEEHHQSPPIEPLDLPPLTGDEELLRSYLEQELKFYQELGEHSVENEWALADVGDHLAKEFRSLGYAIERQGFEFEGRPLQNLSVTVPGGQHGDEIVVLAVHYDSKLGSASGQEHGADLASFLGVVRLMRRANLKRTLQFVALVPGEAPGRESEERGSRHFAEALLAKTESEVIGTIHLQNFGCLSPPPGKLPLGTIGIRSEVFPGGEHLEQAIREEYAQLPFRLFEENVRIEANLSSDPATFQQLGLPTLSLSGAGQSCLVDADELARSVMALRRVIGDISGETFINDGMLTPH
ncbi:MAG: M28 family peptidase [Polyangiaceae bacterium]|nr:M28 family peptidase [Polyangiaceae bacterium]